MWRQAVMPGQKREAPFFALDVPAMTKDESFSRDQRLGMSAHGVGRMFKNLVVRSAVTPRVSNHETTGIAIRSRLVLPSSICAVWRGPADARSPA